MVYLRGVDELLDAAGPAPAVFLDYDGTLTPIVAVPGAAVLSSDMRERIRRLAELCPVAVISGRDREDVRARVGLDALAYAGSHGYDIVGPFGRFEHRVGEDSRDALAALARMLERALADVPGAMVEEKQFSLAVHFRRTAPADEPRVRSLVARVLSDDRWSRFAAAEGKKVLDLRPDAGWHKGKAVRWLLDALQAAGRTPVYVGDDTTDELAFAELSGDGVTVKVGPGPTQARFHLPDVGAVGGFLDALRARL